MKENLDAAGGLPMAEAFVISLSKTDLGRQAAHELIRQITMDAEEAGEKFSDAVSENEIVREKIGEKIIAKCLEPKNYVGHSSEIVDRVLNSVK
jgi:adenylosuccinate lyase